MNAEVAAHRQELADLCRRFGVKSLFGRVPPGRTRRESARTLCICAMMVGMEIRPGLRLDDTALEQFCRRHGIRRLALYGSALGEDFRSDSDVDLLVEFQPPTTPGLIRIAQMELELSDLIGGREVEIRTYEDLSRHFRDAVVEHATTLYDAA